MRKRTRAVSLKDIGLLTILSALIIISFIATTTGARSPISTSETRFVEVSPKGLRIVPASCPSDPHYTGDCTVAVPPLPPTVIESCVNSAAPQSISSGQSTVISWNSTINPYNPTTRTISPTIGTVGPSGSYTVSPTVTTTYVMSGSPSGGGSAYSCQITVAVGGLCPAGQVLQSGACVCPNGLNVAQYPTCTCPTGYTQSGSTCVFVQCSEQFYCQGNDLWKNNSCTGSTRVQACTWGCSGGGCLTPPPASGNITASPALLRSGETTQISWTTQNTRVGSCSVTENNPEITDVWSAENGAQTSGLIAMQTVYTLSCTGHDSQPFTDSVTVNVIPGWVEL